MKKTYFTPGPAEMYPTVEKHFQQAFNEQLGSISHRSQKFRDIYRFTADQLRVLLNIPDASGIFFTGSATEIWERILQNCVEHESFHLVNGSFSSKFRDFSNQLHKYAHTFEKPLGEGFSFAEINVPEYAELIACTANETSTGVQMRVEEIHRLKKSNKNTFVAVDMVSSAPYHDLDLTLVDSAFFSVQKSFGMPAGLGVWIANEAMLEKAERMQKHEGTTIGTYHTLPSLWSNFKKYETPETPNVIAIYVLGKVAEDMNKIGVKSIRRETEEKAKALYQFAEESNNFEIFVQNPAHRSQTVVVLNTENPNEVIERGKKQNMIIGSGYGKDKDKQIRIANFPAVNKAQVEALIAVLKSF